MPFNFHYQKISEHAEAPSKATEFSVGWDRASTKGEFLFPREIKKINLDIKMMLPTGVYGRIASRSGLALKGIIALGGVIDPDYRGNVAVILRNLTNIPYEIKKGDKIAQLISEKYKGTNLIQVKSLETFESRITTLRENGFGSSDVAVASVTSTLNPQYMDDESEEGEIS